MTYALELSQLTKTYAGGVKALRGIDLCVEDGDFYALLGPNGAGKSTTIGIISSLVNKTSGSVKVFGYDLDKEVVNAKRQLGLVPQNLILIHLKRYYRLFWIKRVITALLGRLRTNAPNYI